jgi:colanic acid/amylovoran biosynthesis glycosyltransferase
VKPNAIDGQHFPVTDRPAPAAGQPWRLACVARIEPKKGQLRLAEAVHLLRSERGLRVELHLVGEPDRDTASQEYAKQLKEACAARQQQGIVHFEGRQPQTEVRRFLAQSHVFVAPFVETATGDKDGIPTALLEAMATGAAVVVTDAGSMLEVVTNGVDGLVVPQHDPRALADAMERLLTDPDLRHRLGRAAAATAKERFDVTVCEARLHRRIESVLASRR